MKHNNRFLATLTALCLLGTMVPCGGSGRGGAGGRAPGGLRICLQPYPFRGVRVCGGCGRQGLHRRPCARRGLAAMPRLRKR